MRDDEAKTPCFHPLRPGAALPSDWYPGRIPDNIRVGENSVVDSSFCFRHYRATGPVGLCVGRDVTLLRTSLAVDTNAVIEIGEGCYLANASLVCSERITLGSYVLVAGGVTITDSDFHPLAPAACLTGTTAHAPERASACEPIPPPSQEARPVIIEDDVWIGYNATILKGVCIGAGAVISPGSVVTCDVPAGAHVAGNPARATCPNDPTKF